MLFAKMTETILEYIHRTTASTKQGLTTDLSRLSAGLLHLKMWTKAIDVKGQTKAETN